MTTSLLIANNRYFPSGGPERYLFTIEKALPDVGIQPVPLALRLSENLPSADSNLFIDPPVDESYVFYSDRPLRLAEKIKLGARVMYNATARKQIRRGIRERHCKGVYGLQMAHYLYPEVILAAADCGVPMVMRLSDFQLICPAYSMFRSGAPCDLCKDGLHHGLIHKCLKGSLSVTSSRIAAMVFHRLMRVNDFVSAYVCPSLFMKKMMASVGFPESKLVHLPTPVSDELRNLKFEPPAPGSPALFVGGLYEAKGAQIAVDAALRLGFNLIVAGDTQTPLGIALMDRVAKEGKGNIEFAGFVNGAKLSALYRRAGCVIVPSLWYENSPNVALEAMAHGRAVIASNLGSLPETVIDRQTGLLFKAGDSEDLAQKVDALQKDPAAAAVLGENGRRFILENHTLEVHVQRLVDLFGGLW